jgi:Ca2+-binding RTX toxin-like protein
VDNSLIENFRAPYAGTFYLRTESINRGDFPGAYTLAAERDRAAGPFDPDAPPTAEDDLLFGGTGADRIRALDGDDLVQGLGGGDTLFGGGGSDAILGGSGNDVIDGGGGSGDRLYGESGNDRLVASQDPASPDLEIAFLKGGAGRDTFAVGGIGARASIEDFARGSERIDVSAVDANPAVAGNQAFAFAGKGSDPGTGRLSYYYSDDSTIIVGEATGDGQRDFSVFLDGRVTLAASDFVL